nr:uracil-DNA glycosylase [Desulfobulbaceae bacterium]
MKTQDNPRKILQDIGKTLRFHASLGQDSYLNSEAIHSFLSIPLRDIDADPAKKRFSEVSQAAHCKEARDFKKVDLTQKTLVDIKRELGDCTRCSLHEGRTRILFGAGPADATVFIVGEWPNRVDDAEGVLFSDEQGELLRKMFQAINIDLNDTYLTNIVKCRASEESPPEKDHLSACRPFLLSQIDIISPKVIVTLGPLAAQALLSTNKLLIHLRGRVHRYKMIPLIPIFHPSYLLKTPEMKKAAWIDLQLVQRELLKKG